MGHSDYAPKASRKMRSIQRKTAPEIEGLKEGEAEERRREAKIAVEDVPSRDAMASCHKASASLTGFAWIFFRSAFFSFFRGTLLLVRSFEDKVIDFSLQGCCYWTPFILRPSQPSQLQLCIFEKADDGKFYNQFYFTNFILKKQSLIFLTKIENENFLLKILRQI